MAQELPHGLVLRRQRFQFRTKSRTECVSERDHGQRVADRHHVETRRAFGDDADDLIDLLLAALDQSGGHDRCSVRLDLVEGHPALRRLGRDVIAHLAIPLGFQERGEPGRAPHGVGADLHARQQLHQRLHARRGHGGPVGQHGHLLRAADDGQQLDGRNVRGRVDDCHVGEGRRIGERGKRGRSRHDDGLGRGQDLGVVTAYPAERDAGLAGQHRVQLVGFLSHRRRMDSCATIGPTERTCSVSTCAKRSAADCNADPS